MNSGQRRDRDERGIMVRLAKQSTTSAKLTVEYIHIYDLFVKIITVSQYKNTEKYFYED